MKKNVELLKKTLQRIEDNPQEWTQESWRCETGMCFAGHAALINGARWANPEEPEDDTVTNERGGEEAAAFYAERVLGLTEDEADLLFYGGNDLEDLRRLVAEFTSEDTDEAA